MLNERVRVDVLFCDGVFDTGLSSTMDALSIANLLAGEPIFSVRRVSVRPSVRTAQGLVVPVDAVVKPTDPAPDVVLVPALGCLIPEQLDAALKRPDIGELGAVLSAWERAGGWVTAACTGSFVLAQAGLLDGRQATTTWWLSALFRSRYPAVRLETDRMVVVDGRLVTAGAALGHLDLALWLVRQRSPDLAQTVARYLLFDGLPSQGAYAIADQLAHNDEMVLRFERWVRANLRGFSIADAAQAVGASQRTLQRRVQRVLGRTPIAYVQDVRVEQAVYRLQTTADSLDDIAEQVGYADAVTLRTLLRRKTGRSIRQLRAVRWA